MKCPKCENYFEAGKVKFLKLRVRGKELWMPDEFVRVCPECYNQYGGN